MEFIDRRDAGRRLAGEVGRVGGDVVVRGLPRGGVPVAAEVAAASGAPLDVIMVRKLGVPFQPELGMGAIGEGGVCVLNEEVLRAVGISDAELAEVQGRENAELERRAHLYRQGRPRSDLRGRTAIVVDDGLATGSTARAACLVARAYGAARVVVAVPVAPVGWTARMEDVADELVCLLTPYGFQAVGQWYRDFTQTTDQEVIDSLDEAARRTAGTADTADTPGPAIDPEVRIPIGPLVLSGSLAVPGNAAGIVVFAHGSGSGRHSPRNVFVADALNRAGLATLLFDLLTADEEGDRTNVFDIGLLAERLSAVTGWLGRRPEAAGLPVGFFGASTGAAAALRAAAERDSPVRAVVSRGGRPDLAASSLPAVTAPTLLIVGGADDVVLDLNRQARALLGGLSDLAVVPGATHLFSEPGTLEQVAQLAADWFTGHLTAVHHG
ncbi:MAG: phosphoribosyltransferase [Catenulispora sp.]|nr:phosphoribosyltransferase [Catenulispora sp.]